jgi:hypothetical protein
MSQAVATSIPHGLQPAEAIRSLTVLGEEPGPPTANEAADALAKVQ